MKQKESYTLYKLLILYMLSQVDFPLTTSQISEFVIDHGYTTFFTFQEALTDMVDTNLLIVEATHNRSLYHLTREGMDTLLLFEEQLNPGVKNDVDNYLQEKHYDLKGESGAKSTYRQNANGDFVVRCQIVENGSNLFDMKIIVPTEKEAETMASNWIRKNESIYTSMVTELL